MLTEQDRKFHTLYESMPADQQAAVNDAFRAAADSLRAAGIRAPMDDRAESVVAALARYVAESETGPNR